MIRQAFAGLALLTLAACGQDGPDFAVDVASGAGSTQARLMALDGQGIYQLPGSAPVAVTSPEPGLVRYGFYNGAGEEAGMLLLRIEVLDDARSRIHATLDLPSLEYEIDGEDMVLSEALAENTLEEELRDWAQSMAENGYGSLDEVNATLAALSIAVQPDLVAQLEAPGFLQGSDMGFAGVDGTYGEEAYADGGWGSAPAEPDGAKESFVDPYASVDDDSAAYDDGYGY